MKMYNHDLLTSKDPAIKFMIDDVEFLKIAEDGFYVREKKIPVDDNEAEAVYKAFRMFLINQGLRT